MHLIPYSAKTTPKVCLITALTLKVYAFEGYCLTYSTLMHFGSLERSSPMCPVDNMEREKQKNFQGDGAIKVSVEKLFLTEHCICGLMAKQKLMQRPC